MLHLTSLHVYVKKEVNLNTCEHLKVKIMREEGSFLWSSKITLVANLNELRVSPKLSSFGETLTNIKVLLLPPRQFCSRCVSLLFLYGTWFSWKTIFLTQNQSFIFWYPCRHQIHCSLIFMYHAQLQYPESSVSFLLHSLADGDRFWHHVRFALHV